MIVAINLIKSSQADIISATKCNHHRKLFSIKNSSQSQAQKLALCSTKSNSRSIPVRWVMLGFWLFVFDEFFFRFFAALVSQHSVSVAAGDFALA